MNKNNTLQNLTLKICNSLEMENTLENCFDYIKEHIPADGMTFDVTKPDGSLRSIARVSSAKGVEIYDIPIPLSPEAQKEVKENDNAPAIEVSNVPDVSPTGKDISTYYGYKETSTIVMKLISEIHWKGWLGIYAFGADRYSDKDAEFLSKVKEPFSIAMSNALKYREIKNFSGQIKKENQELYQELMNRSGGQIIGAESGLKEVMTFIKKVSPTDTPVLLLGETGVGKDVMANAVHQYSNRNTGPIIKVNCGAIPKNLMDSELFGHEKGAFTGAVNQKRGKLERADKGTLFLDEVGELSLDAQVRLLRAIQFKEIERVGGTSVVDIDVRIIAATNRNLEELVGKGRFREDLYYRLNVFPVKIPPLRKRKQDIVDFAYYFMDMKSKELNLYPEPELSGYAIEQLISYNWPGNVREMSNVIERALILNNNEAISFDHLKKSELSPEADPVEKNILSDEVILPLDEMIAEYILKALTKTSGRIEGIHGAAKLLNVNPSTLRSKIKKLNIEFLKKV